MATTLSLVFLAPGDPNSALLLVFAGYAISFFAPARRSSDEGYESLTTDDIVDAIDYAIETPRHVNVGMIEIMPTFQVPGGLTFDRR